MPAASFSLLSFVCALLCRAVDQLRHLTDFDVEWGGSTVHTRAWCGVVEGLPVYMLEPQQPAAFFWRGSFYGQVRWGLIPCCVRHRCENVDSIRLACLLKRPCGDYILYHGHVQSFTCVALVPLHAEVGMLC